MIRSDPSADGIVRSRSPLVVTLVASAIAFFVVGVALLFSGGHELIGGVLLAVALGVALCAFVVGRRAE